MSDRSVPLPEPRGGAGQRSTALAAGVEAISRRLDLWLAQQREVGVQYVAADEHAQLLSYTGGVCDVATGRPVTGETLFLSASCSKVLTAAAVLSLVQSGALRLEDPLSRYVPHQPYGEQVRIVHLLNHSSGVPNPLPLKWVHTFAQHASYSEGATLRALLAQHPRLDFTPGARYAYSNLAYWLLGSVIEAVASTDFNTYLQRHILDPLAIPRQELSCEVSSASQLARGHVRRWSPLGMLVPLMTAPSILAKPAGRWRRFEHVYMNGPAYGGARATARAYARLLQDLVKGHSRLLDDETKQLFFAPQYDNSAHKLPTTLGWHTGELAGEPHYSKPGGGPGFCGNLRIYPKRGLVTVFLANQMRASETQIQRWSDRVDSALLSQLG